MLYGFIKRFDCASDLGQIQSNLSTMNLRTAETVHYIRSSIYFKGSFTLEEILRRILRSVYYVMSGSSLYQGLIERFNFACNE